MFIYNDIVLLEIFVRYLSKEMSNVTKHSIFLLIDVKGYKV